MPFLTFAFSFISLALSYLQRFHCALGAVRAFASGFSQSAMMRRLHGISGDYKAPQDKALNRARWRKDFGIPKVVASTGVISNFADAAQFRRYIQVITSINFRIPVYRRQIYYATDKVHNVNENALENPCKNNTAYKIIRIDIRATFPFYRTITIQSKLQTWSLTRSESNYKFLNKSFNVIKHYAKFRLN